MKVLVLGAAGFIGPAVLRRLTARGREPIAVSRTGAAPPGVRALRLDRNDPAALAAAAAKLQPDAVIDLLAYSIEMTAPVLSALAGRTGRYVMASSGDVYRQYDLLHRRARGRPEARLAEDAPLRETLYPYRSDPPRRPDAPDAWMDDYDKIPIEQALAEQDSLAWSIVRLPMVFGPADRNRRFAWALGPMLRGAGVLEVDAAWADWRTSYGFVEDVAEALALAAEHTEAAGQVFNAGPEIVETNAGWAARFADALGWRGEVRRLARGEVPEPTRARLDALDLTAPLVLDTTRIRDRLGYREIADEAEALRRTADDERARTG